MAVAGPNFDASLYPKLFNVGEALSDLPSLLAARRRAEMQDAQARAQERENERHNQELERVSGRQVSVAEGREARESARTALENARKDAMDRVKARESMNVALRQGDTATAGDVGEAWGMGRPAQVLPKKPEAPKAPEYMAATLGRGTNQLMAARRNAIGQGDLIDPFAEREQPTASHLDQAIVSSLQPEEQAQSDTRDFALDPLMERALGQGRARITALYGPEFRGSRQEYQAAKSAHENEAMPQYEAAVAEAKAHPRYTSTDTKGRQLTFEPMVGHEHELQMNAEAADRWHEAVMSIHGGDPKVMVAANFIAGELAAGAIKQTDAGKELNHIIGLLEKPQNADTPEEKMKRAKVMAAPRWAGVHELQRAQDRADRVEPGQRAGVAQAQLTSFLNARGYKADIGDIKQAMDLAQMASSTNGAVNTALAARFANLVQQRGILTDKDYEQFWNKIGDLGERSEAWVEKALTGRFGAKRLADVKEAVGLLAQNAGGHLQQTLKGAADYLTPIHGSAVVAPLLGAVAYGDVAGPLTPVTPPQGGVPPVEQLRPTAGRKARPRTPVGGAAAASGATTEDVDALKWFTSGAGTPAQRARVGAKLKAKGLVQ